MYKTLHKVYLGTYLDTTKQMGHPLAPKYLFWKVLIPEAALGLISEDLGLDKTHPDVMKTLVESRAYGEVMFPDDE